MFKLSTVISEARSILGLTDEQQVLAKCSEAVALVGNFAEFEGWKGWADICTTGEGNYVTLPREVGTVLAVAAGGRPLLGMDQLYTLHLNGPGYDVPVSAAVWYDLGRTAPVHRDIEYASLVNAVIENSADAGKKVILHGYDDQGERLTHKVDGELRSGYVIVLNHTSFVPPVDAPKISRIVAVDKDLTEGPVRLYALNEATSSLYLVAHYEPDETHPRYRRIGLAAPSNWVRIYYRKTNPSFSSIHEHVPLQSRTAFLSALRSIRYRAEENIEMALAFEQDAKRLELEALAATEPNVHRPLQVSATTTFFDNSDYL